MTATRRRATRRCVRALALAAHARACRSGPNPRVGCVLLDADGRTVAEGFHRGAGTPHAEVDALAAAGAAARGATAVVTLEPCNHTGRTGPCAQALLDAGVAAWSSPRPTPTRSPPAAPRPCARPASRSRPGCSPTRRAPLNRAWTFAVDARPAVRDLEVRHHPRRPQRRRRRHQPLDQPRRGRARDAHRLRGAVRRDPRRHRHRRGRRPAADRPRRATTDRSPRQPLRVVMGLRDLPAGPRGSSTTRAETVRLRTRDPREALAELLRAATASTSSSRAARPWPRRSCAAGLVDEVVAYVAPMLLGAGPQRGRRPGHRPRSPTRCTSHVADVTRARRRRCRHQRPADPDHREGDR